MVRECERFKGTLRSTVGSLVVLAAAIVVGSVGAAVAYQIGRSATVATFDFAYVAFAVIWGFVLFQEVPGSKSILGIILIVAAGILAVRKPATNVAAEQGASVDNQRATRSGHN